MAEAVCALDITGKVHLSILLQPDMLYKTVRFLYSIKFHKKYQPADRLRNIFDNERKEIIEQVIINVCNDGAPISKESREEIFVPFFTTKQEGNGTLTLTRSDATGTVFTLIFR